MADLASVWGGLVEIDWSDSGLYDHAASDVSDALGGLRFRWGGSERSNPERPIVDYGGGVLRLTGDRYSLGVSTVLTTAEIQQRHLIRITPPDLSPILGRCTFDNRQASAERSSQFALEGLETAKVSAELDVLQPTVGIKSDSQAFADWVAVQFDLASVDIGAAVRTYDRFRFTGRRGELISQLATTLTAMATAGRDGTLRLHDPTMAPATPDSIDGASLAVTAATSRLDTAHIRNQIAIILGATLDQEVSGVVEVAAPAVLDPGAEIVGRVTVWDDAGTVIAATVEVDSIERRVPDEISTDTLAGVVSQWLCTQGTRQLWRINPDDPSDESGDYGLIGNMPAALQAARGIGYGDGRWLVVDLFGDSLWRINPDDPDDTSGDYGLVGDLPTGLGSVTGIGYGDGQWLAVDNNGDELWRINPDDPDDTSGDYGLVGDLPTGITAPQGIGYGDGQWLVVNQRANIIGELWRINPDDPSDESGDYGLVGTMPMDASRQPISIGYGDGKWLVSDGLFDELWRINPDDPSDFTAPYGLVGDFPSAVMFPGGISYSPTEKWKVDSFQWEAEDVDAAGEVTVASATVDDTGIATVTVDTRDNIITAAPPLTMRWTSPFGSAAASQDHAVRGWSTRSAALAMSEFVDHQHDLAYVFGLRATVTITFDVDVPTDVENTSSIAAWGPRPLPLPDWLHYLTITAAQAVLQPIVDAFGEPRRLHTITLAVPQVDATDNATIDVDPGDYRRIIVADTRLPTNIDSVCMILAAELIVNRAQEGSLRLVCIES